MFRLVKLNCYSISPVFSLDHSEIIYLSGAQGTFIIIIIIIINVENSCAA